MGKIKHRWPGAYQAGQGVFAPDSRSVVTYDAILRRWDVGTGQLLYADVSPQGHTAAVEHLFFTPDGRHLASVAEDATLRVWDVNTSKQLYKGKVEGQKPKAWALAPDGLTLVGLDDGLNVQRWSLPKARSEKSFNLLEAKNLDIRFHPLGIRFDQSGQMLAVSLWPPFSPDYSLTKFSFSFWDFQTGRLTRWGSDPGKEYRGDRGRLSPDGRFAMAEGVIYDTRTPGFKLPLALYESTGKYDRPLFSPNGRFLAKEKKKGMRVWEVVNRPAFARLLLEADDFPRAALTPDGRLLAVKNPHGFQIWDLRTAKVILERQAPPGRNRYDSWTSADFTFSPDGRTLATGQTDGTILLWNMPPEAKPSGPLTEKEMISLWADLVAEDPATWAPGRGVAFSGRRRDRGEVSGK